MVQIPVVSRNTRVEAMSKYDKGYWKHLREFSSSGDAFF
jgi:hypothetical protein